MNLAPRALLTAILFAAAALPAAAQPSKAQADAVRANCRSDFLKNCEGVPRGGPEALTCLRNNSPKLSAGCQKAVAAIPK